MSAIRLHDLNDSPSLWWAPYKLLEEREAHVSINHKSLPTWAEHCAFVDSRPYAAWYAVRELDGWATVGCVYLTHRDEIGIGILKAHRRKGYAAEAIRQLMQVHPRARYVANINPANEPSIALFKALGFGDPIQLTFERLA